MTDAVLRQDTAYFCRQCQPRLAEMLAAAGQGRPPDPGELFELRARAQDLAGRLARRMGLDEDPEAAARANPEVLALWEKLLGLCVDLTALGLELVRSWGPAYLPPSEDAW